MHALILQLGNALRKLAIQTGHEQPGVTDPHHMTRGPLAEDVREALAAFDARLAQAPKPATDLHTAEPWSISAEGETDANADGFATGDVRVEGLDGLTVIAEVCAGLPAHETNANARRIIACVNACAGIPTELLESLELGELDAAINDGSRDPSHPMLGR